MLEVEALQGYLQSAPLLAYVVVFVAGVLTSFTPCVYPMIPITVGYVGGHSGASKERGFLLSVSYVFGVAVTYSTLGAFAALTGRMFGEISTNPVVHFVVANICILLGLSMLDVFVLPVPSFATKLQPKTRGKGLIGAFAVGWAAGWVAAPCAAPVLGVLLAFVATRQRILFGMSLMFVFAVGMGALLVLVGTFAGLVGALPKSGAWMAKIQKGFGWVMIAAGEYYLVQAGRFVL